MYVSVTREVAVIQKATAVEGKQGADTRYHGDQSYLLEPVSTAVWGGRLQTVERLPPASPHSQRRQKWHAHSRPPPSWLQAEWHKEQTLKDHQCKLSLSMSPRCASLHACTQLSASPLAVVPQRRSTVRCGCERAAGSTGQLRGWLATTEPLLYSM